MCTETDPNFKELGYNITEYDIQKSSGILDALVNMPHYTLAVFPGPSMKKDIVLKAYARPTIPWSLKCESQGKTRKNLLDSIQFGLKASEPDKASLLFWGIWVMLGMFPNNASPTVILIFLLAGMFIAAII
jgi:hypothetical protein